MKTKPFIRICASVIFIALLASCHKSNTAGRYIPSGAVFAAVVDGKSIASKIAWADIKQNAILQDVVAGEQTPELAKTILNSPDSAGIDLAANMVFFVQKDSVGGYAAFEGNVKDESLFRKFIKQVDSPGSEIQKDDITFINNYPVSIGWNKERFICVIDIPAMAYLSQYSNRLHNDSISLKNRDVGITCQSIFALDENNSLAKNDKFSGLVKETADIHFWLNTQQFYELTTQSSIMGMLNMDDFYKDNVTTANLNFDNGKITMNTKSYMNDKLLALYKNYVTGTISEEMIQRLPGKELSGVLAVNFKTEGIKELLKLLSVDGMANGVLKKFGLTLDDVTGAFKGDFMVGATDFHVQIDSVQYGGYNGSAPYKYAEKNPKGNFVFAASINDKDKFNKVFGVLKDELGLSTNDSSISFDNNGSYFVVSNSAKTTAAYLAGASNHFDGTSKINDEPFGLYINTQQLLNGAKLAFTDDSMDEAIYNATVKTWDNVYWKDGSLSDNAATGYLEVNMMDNSTNSLKQLDQYINTVSAIVKQQEKKDAHMYNDTSLRATPVDSSY